MKCYVNVSRGRDTRHFSMAVMLKPPSVEPVSIDSRLFLVYYLNVYTK